MDSVESSRNVFVARLILGLAQGLALYFLYSALDQRSWPATVPLLFAPLTVVALFIPLLLLQGLGNLRAATLLIWTAAAALIVSGLAFYDVWHAWPAPADSFTPPFSAKLLCVCALFLFVAHALVSCGDADRRIVARYTTLFDLAWKLGVQIAIAACFVASFWLILGLGVALFHMIKLNGFARFISHPWVWIPFTTIATAVSIHITDTRANLVRGVRTLALTLLGWLLPVITAIAFAFLISLMVTGLQPLWETRYATFLLLAAAAVLVIHINAAYQDGDTRPHHVLRVAGTLASVLLVFIVSIAAYALWLRVNQYGWTVERITTAGCIAVAAMFAVGYLIAAVLPSPWLKLIERWNVYGTFTFLIVLLALHTPIADPMRISVNDQLARLNAGKVKAEKFDFDYLRWSGGRFGQEALTQLASSRDATVAEMAKHALAYDVSPQITRLVSRSVSQATGPGEDVKMKAYPVPSAEDLLRGITVYPMGRKLPDSFVHQDWSKGDVPVCFSPLRYPPKESQLNYECAAILGDFYGQGNTDILIYEHSGAKGNSSWSTELYREANGHWAKVANFVGLGDCDGDLQAMKDGRFKTSPGSTPARDLVIDGRHIPIVPSEAQPAKCPAN